MSFSAATVKVMRVGPHKAKNRTMIRLSNTTPGHVHEGINAAHMKTLAHPCLSCTVHSSQVMESMKERISNININT
jgi:hypothetical protein